MQERDDVGDLDDFLALDREQDVALPDSGTVGPSRARLPPLRRRR